MRHISDAGLAIIKRYETLRLEAYLPTEHDVPTIGYGHTVGVKMGDTCTEEQADQWLREDVEASERCVERALGDAVATDNEFDAMVSLAFNIGCGGFQRSTVLRLVVDGSENDDLFRHAFKLWNKQRQGDKMVVLNGLTKRRAEEAEHFLA